MHWQSKCIICCCVPTGTQITMRMDQHMKTTLKMASLAAVLAICMCAQNAFAQTASGTLTVTGTISSSLTLLVQNAGGTTSGTGTAAATSALGNISKFGSAPTGFTLSGLNYVASNHQNRLEKRCSGSASLWSPPGRYSAVPTAITDCR